MINSEAYVGLDIGGTSVKAGVFDCQGKLLGFEQSSHCVNTGEAGRAELDIENLYSAVRYCVAEAVRRSRASVRTLAISSQGETFVCLDAMDRPLHPAIIWYDSRGEGYADQLRHALRETEASLLPIIEAICTAPKIMWMRDHLPDVISQTRRFLLIPDYLSYKLTGEAVIDPITAASTGLCAYGSEVYLPAALAAAGIQESQLARIQSPGNRIGAILPEVAKDWGLTPETVLIVGANDQFAGALGAGNCRLGIVSETTGTCLALVTLAAKDSESTRDGLFSAPFMIPSCDFLMSYSKTAGVVLEWFRTQFFPDKHLWELDALAATSPPGCNGVTVSPHFDGTSIPRLDATARGFIGNLSLNHGVADIYRAILESICFCAREHLEALQKASTAPQVIRSSGGGARSDLWLQMKADVVGLPVERPLVTESAVFGAAMLAAAGAGHFSSPWECSDAWYASDRVFAPNPDVKKTYDQAYQSYRKLCGGIYGWNSP